MAQAEAMAECIAANAGNAGGNQNICDTGKIECRVANTGHTAWNSDTLQADAVIERIAANTGGTVWNCKIGKIGTVIECLVPNASDTAGNCEVGQTVTKIKCSVSDSGDTIRYHYICQVATIKERIVADIGNTIWHRIAADALSFRKVDKQSLIQVEQNPGDTAEVCIIWSHRDCCQMAATNECILADVGDAVADSNIGQTGAAIECMAFDDDHAVMDRNLVKLITDIKCSASNAGDWHVFNFAGDCHNTIEPRVFSDGNGIVGIGHISELRQPRGWQCQQQRGEQAELNPVSHGFHDD